MRVIETYKEATAPYYDNAGPWTIVIEMENGDRTEVYANEPEPEDASFNRDLSFVFDISDLLKKAYEAGRNGETYHYEYKELKGEEEK